MLEMLAAVCVALPAPDSAIVKKGLVAAESLLMLVVLVADSERPLELVELVLEELVQRWSTRQRPNLGPVPNGDQSRRRLGHHPSQAPSRERPGPLPFWLLFQSGA